MFLIVELVVMLWKIIVYFFLIFMQSITFTPRGILTLILLTWRMLWAPNNANRWQMGFNLVFKELMWS